MLEQKYQLIQTRSQSPDDGSKLPDLVRKNVECKNTKFMESNKMNI